MIGLFFTILLLSTAICFDLPFITPSIFILKIEVFFPHNLLKSGFLIFNLLFLYWTFVEANKKRILNKIKMDFITSFRLFIEKKNGQRIENLLNPYPNIINSRKDIYYINRTLIIKTNNNWNDNKFSPPGISLRIGKIKLTWLTLSRAVKTILEKEVFQYIVLLLWGVIMVGIFVFQLII